jgi:PBSX family phage terminase large subunit
MAIKFKVPQGLKLNYPPPPTEKQRLFHETTADDILYGGAVGGGKSHALITQMFMDCIKHPGIVIAVFRRTIPQLRGSLIREVLKGFPRGRNFKLWHYDRQAQEISFWNDSLIEFHYCETIADALQYSSFQWDRVVLEQAEELTEDMLTELTLRARATKIGITPRIYLTCNPQGAGAAWLYERYVAPNEPNETWTPRTESGLPLMPRVFIPARIQDNPHLLDKDPTYLARLENLGPTRRRQLLEGEWGVYEGIVLEEWNRRVHVVVPFEIPDDWYQWVSVDYGYAEPWCVLWFAESPKGEVYVVKELYKRRVKDADQAKWIVAYGRRLNPNAYMGGHDMRVKEGQTGKSAQMIYKEEGVPLRCIKPDRSRKLEALHRYFAWKGTPAKDGNYIFQKAPKIRLFNTCVNTIRTMPTLIYDKDGVDIRAGSEDHACDALGLGLLWHTQQKSTRKQHNIPYEMMV